MWRHQMQLRSAVSLPVWDILPACGISATGDVVPRAWDVSMCHELSIGINLETTSVLPAWGVSTTGGVVPRGFYLGPHAGGMN